MEKVLYLDCFSGASGDMVLGALIDLGVPLDGLRAALATLLPDGCELTAARVSRSGIGAIQFDVRVNAGEHHASGHAPHRGLQDILEMIAKAGLPAQVAIRASLLFERLGRVEAEIHQVPVERVHFHEVGALDSIVDIVGSVWAIDTLGVDRVCASPLNTGSGTVATAHGQLPVPAPATIRLLEGAPAYSSGVQGELLTPTGALLVTGHATSFGPMPAMTIRRTGYGAGQRQVPGQPNVLRAVLGEATASSDHGRVLVLECNIDDMNPQFYGNLVERLQAAGALDCYLAPVQMKKNRPGTLVTVLAPVGLRESMLDLLFRETTTIGVRYHEAERECLSREWTTVSTRFGAIRVKLARRGTAVMNAAPEYEDCAARAAERKASVRDVHAAAVQAYLESQQEQTSHEH
ncbi:MAG: nickel pincer cofactor biosynthesis protein LarC [Vicinamibacterales bacterium]